VKHALLIITTIAVLRGAARADAPSAERLYTEGQSAYDREDYAAAIAKWRESYRLSGESALLFNIAQALRLSGSDECAALATYEKFITTDHDPTTSTQHNLAEDYVIELRGEDGPTCGPSPTAPTNTQPALGVGLNLVDRRTDPNDRGRKLRVAGIVTTAGGGATIAIGLLLGHHAQALADEVTQACRTSCDWGAQKAKDTAGRSDATIGRVLDVAGAVGIAGGVVTYYLGLRGSHIDVAPSGSGLSVSWSGSW